MPAGVEPYAGGIAESDAEGKTVVAFEPRELFYDLIVAGVGDVEIAVGVDREAGGAGEGGAWSGKRQGGDRGATRRQLVDFVVGGVGDVEVADLIEGEAGGCCQGDVGDGEGGCGVGRASAERDGVDLVARGDIEVTGSVEGMPEVLETGRATTSE